MSMLPSIGLSLLSPGVPQFIRLSPSLDSKTGNASVIEYKSESTQSKLQVEIIAMLTNFRIFDA